jgi:hypothetical protein
MNWLSVALTAYFIVLAIGIFLYFRPRFIREGFATHAITSKFPSCFSRDIDAQQLITKFQTTAAKTPDQIANVQELTLILQKVLCIDADVSGQGAGVYSTQKLPYATSHDMGPVQNLVARCVSKSVRSNEIEVVMDKFQARGNALITSLCSDSISQRESLVQFHNILSRATSVIKTKCATPKTDMDIPAGPRDPGYHIPDSLLSYSEYNMSGDEPQYI